MTKGIIKTYPQFPGVKFYTMEQGSPEWHDERMGSAGASETKSAFAGGAGKTRTALLKKKVREVCTGEREPSIKTFDMDWGLKYEDEAAEYFESATGLKTFSVGMVRNDKFPGFHDSPDRIAMIGDKLVYVEIKCPKRGTHEKYMAKFVDQSKVWTHPVEYKTQFAQHAIIPGCTYGFFVSYFPGHEAQIVSRVPFPDRRTVHHHHSEMERWNIDYERMLLRGESLVAERVAELKKKDEDMVAMIAAVNEKTSMVEV